jgi:broad specificity phosphatase PhoE
VSVDRVFVFARHGHSESNGSARLNGDPRLPAGLTPEGERQARFLGDQLANVTVDVAVVSRFPRTRRTAELALEGQPVPIVVEPFFDEIDVGRLEGRSIESYRGWKRAHPVRQPFPGGESLLDAVARYLRALRAVADRPERMTLVVAHELPLRYLLDAARGTVHIDDSPRSVPHAVPFLMDERTLRSAIGRLDALWRSAA